MLNAPAPTAYDLRFKIFGFPVRVSAWFWLGSLLLGYRSAVACDNQLVEQSPGVLPLLLIWTGCVFVSILIHELGHTLAFRRFRVRSSIVLYHLGGLAIPGGEAEEREENPFAYDPSESFARSQHPDAWRDDEPSRSKGSLRPKQSIFVSLAGPLLQIASALVLIAIVKLFGYRLSLEFLSEGFNYMLEMDVGPLHLLPETIENQLFTGNFFSSPSVYFAIDFYLFVSLYWAMLNLVPVWPLDGGQVAEQVVALKRAPRALTFQISLVASICLVIYAFSKEQTFMAIMFAFFAYNSFQMMQQSTHRRF